MKETFNAKEKLLMYGTLYTIGVADTQVYTRLEVVAERFY